MRFIFALVGLLFVSAVRGQQPNQAQVPWAQQQQWPVNLNGNLQPQAIQNMPMSDEQAQQLAIRAAQPVLQQWAADNQLAILQRSSPQFQQQQPVMQQAAMQQQQIPLDVGQQQAMLSQQAARAHHQFTAAQQAAWASRMQNQANAGNLPPGVNQQQLLNWMQQQILAQQPIAQQPIAQAPQQLLPQQQAAWQQQQQQVQQQAAEATPQQQAVQQSGPFTYARLSQPIGGQPQAASGLIPLPVMNQPAQAVQGAQPFAGPQAGAADGPAAGMAPWMLARGGNAAQNDAPLNAPLNPSAPPAQR